MATIIELTRAGAISKLDACLDPRQQEWRSVYLLPQLRNWFETTLPELESTWNIEESPIEQMDALLAIFCSGETLTYGWQFKPLVHLGDGIWELKTADLRMFGWFTAKDCFIGADADTSERIKRLHMYQAYCKQAVRRRDALDLNEPKFVPGDNPNDVVSAFDFAP